MIDLTPLVVRAQIFFSIFLIIVALVYYFFIKLPRRSKKR